VDQCELRCLDRDSEDVAAWELLWDAREAFARAEDARAKGREDAPGETALSEARESLLAAEGSDGAGGLGRNTARE